MSRQIKNLESAASYMYQFIAQLDDVRKSIQRDDEGDKIDLSYLVNSESLCNQIIENISNQIETITRFELHLKEEEEKIKGREEIKNKRRE